MYRDMCEKVAKIEVALDKCHVNVRTEDSDKGARKERNCMSVLRNTLVSMRICDFWSKDPPWLHFKPQKLLNFDFNADKDPDVEIFDPKCKILQQKFFIFLNPHEGRPSYGRSLQPSNENIQHFKTWNFLNFLYFCR
jgi:hypothetical protein